MDFEQYKISHYQNDDTYSYARVQYNSVQPSAVSVHLRQAESQSIFRDRIIALSRDLYRLSEIDGDSRASGRTSLEFIFDDEEENTDGSFTQAAKSPGKRKKRDKDKYARPKKRCQRSKDDEENTVGSSSKTTKGPGKRKKPDKDVASEIGHFAHASPPKVIKIEA
uniref:Uncharacterized protein n=1 Tax=Magallana gigas TaxID=29159 RepID=K1QPX7_MAGGI